MKFLVIGFLQLYKMWVSPFLPPSCRFTPSCSTYAMEAVEKFGIFKGTLKGFWRLLRCQPLCKGGHDPVR